MGCWIADVALVITMSRADYQLIMDGVVFSGPNALAKFLDYSVDWVQRRVKFLGRRTFTREELFAIVLNRGGNQKEYLSVTLRDEGMPDMNARYCDMRKTPEKFGLQAGRTTNFFRFRAERANWPSVVSRDFFNCDAETFRREYETPAIEREKKAFDMNTASMLDQYQIEPIKLPAVMGETEMAPYRNLAAAILLDATRDLIPNKHNRGASSATRRAHEMAQADSAERFLLGKSSPEDLELWCALIGLPMSMVVESIRDDKRNVVERIKYLTRGTGRGRCQKQRGKRLLEAA